MASSELVKHWIKIQIKKIHSYIYQTDQSTSQDTFFTFIIL